MKPIAVARHLRDHAILKVKGIGVLDTRYLQISNNLSDLPNAGTARDNLGLGTIATQDANDVLIIGGEITGITDLAIADGGTGASTAAGARAGLDVYSTGEVDTIAGNYVLKAGDTMTGALVITPTVDTTSILQVNQADTTPVFNVDTTNARVGIGTDSPDSAFHIKAGTSGTVGSHPAGQLIIQNPTASVFSNAVITGYESDGDGNPNQQLWYLGNSSSGSSDIIYLNRRNSKLHLGTNNSTRMTILGNGNVGIGTTGPDAKLDIHGDTRLGDSDDGNYLNVSPTGVVTLLGSAKRWLAVRPDLDFTTITAQGKPTQVVVGVFHGYSMPVYNNDNEEMFFNVHVPGRWDEASNPVVHLLVGLAGAEDVSDNFKFQVSWEHLTKGDVIPVTSHDVEVEQAVLTDRNAQYSTYELQFTIDYDVDDPDNLADHDDLAFRLRRIDATNPDVTNEIIILDYHVEFQVDKMFDGDAI